MGLPATADLLAPTQLWRSARRETLAEAKRCDEPKRYTKHGRRPARPNYKQAWPNLHERKNQTRHEARAALSERAMTNAPAAQRLK
ncbi:MAG: hypothetical protein ACRD22_16370 [Terriglobia bacterium]